MPIVVMMKGVYSLEDVCVYEVECFGDLDAGRVG